MLISKPLSLGRVAVLVFSKPPIEGRVKTRLAKTVGDSLAVHIYKSVVRRIFQELTLLNDTDLYLSVADGEDHIFFKQLMTEFDLGLHRQEGFDLGQKMLTAMDEMLAHYDAVIIVGGDAVSISSSVLSRCFERLISQELIIVPSVDGGYVAIGGRRTHGDMFDGIHWGTDEVFSQQLERLRDLKLSSYIADKLWDLDDLNDLERTLKEDAIVSTLCEAGLDLERVLSKLHSL